MYPEDLHSPRLELSNGGLGIIVALLVHPGIDFSCVSAGGPIQLYGQTKLIERVLYIIISKTGSTNYCLLQDMAKSMPWDTYPKKMMIPLEIKPKRHNCVSSPGM